MSLLPEWRTLLARAWSVRLILLACVLDITEVAMSYVSPEHSGGWFGALSFIVTVAAGVSRLLAQPRMTDG